MIKKLQSELEAIDKKLESLENDLANERHNTEKLSEAMWFCFEALNFFDRIPQAKKKVQETRLKIKEIQSTLK